MVDEEFARWAVGYSGFDGGNPRGSTWLCGIENAGDDTDETLVFNDASVPGFVGDHSWPQGGSEFLSCSRFNQNAIKLLMAIKGRSDFENCRAFFKSEKCFRKDSDYFKLNLYPIAFRDVSPLRWMSWHTKRTGFDDKVSYWQWCADKRFKMMRTWVREFSPKLIVCAGVTERDYFFQAFTDGEVTQSCTAGNKSITYALTNAGKTLVAVTYFLGGRWGLNSDVKLRETGIKLAELTRERRT
jgi:hypothetical protein